METGLNSCWFVCVSQADNSRNERYAAHLQYGGGDRQRGAATSTGPRAQPDHGDVPGL